MAQHAVLVYARFVRKRVFADNRFVARDREPDHAGEHSRRRVQLGRIDTGVQIQHVFSHLQRHDDLFKRCVSGALTDSVDRYLRLAGAGTQRTDRIRDCKAQIIVAVNTQNRLVNIGHAVANCCDQCGVFFRYRVANRIGDVENRCPFFNRHLQNFAHKVDVRSGGIFR